MVDRHVDPDVAAVAPPHHVDMLHAQVIEQRDHVLGHVVVGEGTGPIGGPPILQALLPVCWFCLKVFFFMFLYVWVRWTLPRFRYDQLMAFGWKFLLPLAIANIVVTALIVAWRA